MTSPTIHKHADFEAADWGEFAGPPQLAPGYTTQVLAHQPVAYWRLGESSGHTAFDASGHGHHATYQNNCLLNQPGALHLDHDPAVYLDGQAARVDLPAGLTLAVNDPVTLTFWNRVNTAELQKAYTVWIGTSEDPNRRLVHAPWDNQTLYFDYGTNNSQGRIQTDYTPYLDRWTHVALVSEGRLGAFKAIYLDGQAVATSNTSDGPAQTLSGGSLSVAAALKPDRQHRGRLDELAVFNQALTASEIQAQFQAGSNPWA